MQIILITGGVGSGKSTFADHLLGLRYSQADMVRDRLALVLPEVKWHDKTQLFKDTPHVALGDATPRSILIKACEALVAETGPSALAILNISRIQTALGISAEVIHETMTLPSFIVDDVRRIAEIEAYRALARFGRATIPVIHYHVDGGKEDVQPTASAPSELRALANYVINRQKDFK